MVDDPADDDEEEKELELQWGTVIEIKPWGVRMELENGQPLSLPRFWVKVFGHDTAGMKVGTRLRCVVEVKWNPSYHVRAIDVVVHEGGKK